MWPPTPTLWHMPPGMVTPQPSYRASYTSRRVAPPPTAKAFIAGSKATWFISDSLRLILTSALKTKSSKQCPPLVTESRLPVETASRTAATTSAVVLGSTILSGRACQRWFMPEVRSG